MKKIFRNLLGLLTVGLFAVSCSDATDIIQKGEGGEGVIFASVEDLQVGLNGVYLTYNPGANSNGQGDVILFNDLFTDNIKTGSAYGGHGVEMYQHFLQAASQTPRTIWSNRYATINYANRVLRAAERLESTVPSGQINELNHIKAQLYALRAIAHYDIFMYFTSDYQNSSALSAIIMDYVPEIADKPARNTAGEVIDFIFDDLQKAEDNLASGGNSPFYINIDVVNAFRAKLALAAGDYPTAGALAGDLYGRYHLSVGDVYTDMWKDLSNGEIIFGLLRVVGNSQVAGSWYANFTNIDGAPLFEMSQQLYDLYDADDIRRDAFLDETGEPYQSNGHHLINKYPGGERELLNHLKIVRASEMAFILAEVQARNQQFGPAAATLQAVTDARYGGAGLSPAISFSSTNEALARILEERRKELCFEGHRYLDLKRIGREIGVGVNRLASDAASFSNTAPLQLQATDHRFTLPIPQTEISANRAVEQNPGYTNN